MKNPDSTISPPPPPVNLSEKDIARFWSKVDKNGPTILHMESPCWIWTASKESGYGRVKIGRKMFLAHRIAWLITSGPIPHDKSAHGICVCHRCDNPACSNPSHLFLGTHTDNMRDREIKKRGNQPRGDKSGARLHPEKWARGEEHFLSKLATTQVIDIRTIYAAGGITLKQLAAQFGVTFATVGKIINRKTWKHVP
jgi:hypothetical protein